MKRRAEVYLTNLVKIMKRPLKNILDQRQERKNQIQRIKKKKVMKKDLEKDQR